MQMIVRFYPIFEGLKSLKRASSSRVFDWWPATMHHAATEVGQQIDQWHAREQVARE